MLPVSNNFFAAVRVASAWVPFRRGFIPIALLAGWVGMGMGGCDFPDRPDLGGFRKEATWANRQGSKAAIEAGLASMVAKTPVDVPFPTQWERHELRFRNESVTGRTHLKSTSDDDEITVEVDQASVRMVGQAEVLDTIRQTWIHDREGNLQRVRTQWRFGPGHRHQVASVVGDVIEIEDVRRPRSKTTKLSVDQGLASPLVVYQTLLRQPLLVGQRRQSKVVIPAIPALASLQMECTGEAAIAGLIPTTKPLRELRVISETVGGPARAMMYWFDEQGVVEKSYIEGQSESSFRCTPEQYTSLGDPIDQRQSVLRVAMPGKSVPSQNVKQVGYEVTAPMPWIVQQLPPPETGDESSSASSVDAGAAGRPTVMDTTRAWSASLAGPRQYVQTIGPGRYRVIVSRDVPEPQSLRNFTAFVSDPTAADVKVNPLVDYRSAEVKRLANLVARGTGRTPQEVVLAMTQNVRSLLTWQPFGEKLRSASEIANSSVADSTEQAILLIALLRNRSIACRIAMGLRADPAGGPMQYHAWVLAYADDAWMSVDPLAGGSTPADRLMLSSSDLSDYADEAFFQPFMQTVAAIRISVFAAVQDPS